MPNPFRKSRDIEKPYAIYEAGVMGMQWRILKTYKMAKNEDHFSRWFVAAKSEATFGDFELGDCYKSDVIIYGRLVAADPEWIETYRPGLVAHGMDPQIPTPSEYLDQTADA